MKLRAISFAFAAIIFAPAFSIAEDAPKVTANDYVRAESDYQFKTYIKIYDCFGKFVHSRAAYDVDNQITVRGNRDTLYSFGIFDLTSPLTVTMPDPKGRYQSLMIVSQDHSISAVYSPKVITLTEKKVGTRYVFLVIRTFMDPNDKADVMSAHNLQDKVTAKQADQGKLEVPNWDKEDVEAMRATINVVAATVADSSKMFGIFGGDSSADNYLPIVKGWNYIVRQYRPREELLDGTWTFPAPVEVK